MRCYRAVGFEDGDAIGTDIERSVGQAGVRGWDGVICSLRFAISCIE